MIESPVASFPAGRVMVATLLLAIAFLLVPPLLAEPEPAGQEAPAASPGKPGEGKPQSPPAPKTKPEAGKPQAAKPQPPAAPAATPQQAPLRFDDDYLKGYHKQQSADEVGDGAATEPLPLPEGPPPRLPPTKSAPVPSAKPGGPGSAAVPAVPGAPGTTGAASARPPAPPSGKGAMETGKDSPAAGKSFPAGTAAAPPIQGQIQTSGSVTFAPAPAVRRPPRRKTPPPPDPLAPFKQREATEKYRADQVQGLRDEIAALEARLDYLKQKRIAIVDPLNIMPRAQSDEDRRADAALKPNELLQQVEAEIAATQVKLDATRTTLAEIQLRFGTGDR
jgi:hypothetical protein